MCDYEYDVIIIGGGVVGCAVIFTLTNHGYKCLLLEKNPEILREASSGNSGMLHTGFDAPLHSKELHCIKVCQAQIYPLIQKWNIPFKKHGATMVAWNTEQKEKIDEIQKSCIEKGINEVYTQTESEVYSREPRLYGGEEAGRLNRGLEAGSSPRQVEAGLWIPGESVVDPWLLPVCMLQHSLNNHSQVMYNCEVTGIRHYNHISIVSTTRGSVTSRVVINCAGLYGDIVDNMIGRQSFSIQPRKGQYMVYDKNTSNLFNSSILPVPTTTTKGIILFKSVYDNVIIGPTAEDVNSRAVPPPIENHTRQKLYTAATNIVPSLSPYTAIGDYTGLRPATQYQDYQINTLIDRNWITVGGIRSTGLSGCLGIGDMVKDEMVDHLSLDPTYGPSTSVDSLPWKFTNHNSVQFLDSNEYYFVHPITKFGHQFSSKL